MVSSSEPPTKPLWKSSKNPKLPIGDTYSSTVHPKKSILAIQALIYCRILLQISSKEPCFRSPVLTLAILLIVTSSVIAINSLPIIL